ncbi:MAG: penicillin-binding protein 2 [Alphaproteobacteria bacterium]|nr:penicillin-binding protein 2 [Alphaproteobacteria bacterium]
MKKWRFPGSENTSQPNLPGLFSFPKRHRLSTPREQALTLAKARLSVVFLCFAAAWVLIGARLGYLTLFGDPQTTVARSSDTPIARADITDRNGTVLATSLPTTSLCVDSRAIIDADEAAKKLLSALPDLNAKKLGEDLRNGKHCTIIRRHLTPRQHNEVNRLGIAGVNFLPDEHRIYPAGNLTAHVVGYSDIDNRGLAGIEKTMDERLDDNPQPLTLAVDLRVQSIMRRELQAAMKAYRAQAAAGIVMDIRTGELLSLVSLPDFDPSRAGSANDKQMFNRATLGVYEMGSTFKIFNTAYALDSGSARLSDIYDTTHPLEIGRHTIRDFEKEDRNLNVAEIFTHSSNIGSARMAQRFGGERQRAFLTRLGLIDRQPLEIPEVGTPLVPSAKDWSEATTMTASFGQGIAVNAVQLVSAVATVVNDGHPVHPTLIKRDASYEPDVDTVISPHTSAIMRGLMRLVVTHGTAKKANVEGYLVGGKTGTAQKSSSRKKYMENARLSSFLGTFPINAPRYIVFAILDDPKGNAKTYGFATGGWVVAPTVNNVICQIAPLLGMPPLTKETNRTAERQVLKPLGSVIIDGTPAEGATTYAAAGSETP